MPVTITEDDTEFVSLFDLKDHLNITSGRDDAELDMYRGAAEDAVTHLVGPVLHTEVTETVTARGGVVILSSTPIVSVDPVAAVTWTVNPASGLLSAVDTTEELTVTYTVGRSVVPDAIILATVIIAGHLWKTQQGQSPSMLQGDEPLPQYGVGFAIPARAMDLLAPYLLPPTVA